MNEKWNVKIKNLTPPHNKQQHAVKDKKGRFELAR